MKSTFMSLLIGILLIALVGFGSHYIIKRYKISADISTATKGDINGDGKVDALDLNAVLSDISSGKYDKKADLNGDGKVDTLDLNYIISSWSQ